MVIFFTSWFVGSVIWIIYSQCSMLAHLKLFMFDTSWFYGVSKAAINSYLMFTSFQIFLQGFIAILYLTLNVILPVSACVYYFMIWWIIYIQHCLLENLRWSQIFIQSFMEYLYPVSNVSLLSGIEICFIMVWLIICNQKQFLAYLQKGLRYFYIFWLSIHSQH